MAKFLVAGAGIAGCTAALLLERAGHDVLVLERGGRPGGLCRDGLFGQECGPHVMHTDDEEVYALLRTVCGICRVDAAIMRGK